MNLFKKITLIVLLLIVSGCSMQTVIHHDESTQPLSEIKKNLNHKMLPNQYTIDPLSDVILEAKAAILIHAATGDVLFEKNINESVAVASMSKLMSELLVLEALEVGKVDWNDDVKVSDYAYTISSQPGYATVNLQQGERYTVGDLFQAMAISSANGATIALAEKVSKSEKEFVHAMNEKALQLGLQDSHFVNSTGLTNIDLKDYHSVGTVADKNMMSAKDLATLAHYLIDTYPELLEITNKKAFDFGGERFMNSNWMLPGTKTDLIDKDVSFTGVDGFKTGFTKDAGYGFTGTVEMDNKRFISVVIGTESIEKRFLETKHLYEEVLKQQK